MALRHISEEEMRRTLQRAQEIHQSLSPESEHDEMFIRAAEEIGISREAMVQAIQERQQETAAARNPGDFVFAPSDDGFLYAGTITSVTGERILVRFLNGSERAYDASQIQPVAFLPGSKVQFKFPGLGWTTGRVTRYDPIVRTVFVTSIWDTETQERPLSQVRLAPVKPAMSSQMQEMLLKVAIATGATGTALGFLLGHLLR